MADKYLLFEQLREHGVLVGRRQLDRLEAQGLFPKRVHLSRARICWLAAEIEAHVKARIKAREVQE